MAQLEGVGQSVGKGPAEGPPEDLHHCHDCHQASDSSFVNRESCDVALCCCSLAFALPGSEPREYFNFALDILVLSHRAQLANAFTRGDLSRLWRIIAPRVKFDDSGD